MLGVGEVEGSGEMEGKGDVGGVDMTGLEADADGTGEVMERVKDGGLEQGLIFGRGGLAHVAEEDGLDAFEEAGVAEVEEHAIPLEGFDADVFEEEQGAGAWTGGEGSAERFGEKGEAAAPECAGADARGVWIGGGAKQAKTRFRAEMPWLGGGEGSSEAGCVDASIKAAGEVGAEHGGVEGDEADLVLQPGMEGGVVGVAEEGFGVATDEVEVEMGEEFGGSPAAAGAEDGVEEGVGEGGVEVAEAVGESAGEVEGAGGEGVRHEDGLEAELTEGGDAGVDAVWFGRGGGGDDRDAVAEAERGRTKRDGV